jgi:hypothetical protein
MRKIIGLFHHIAANTTSFFRIERPWRNYLSLTLRFLSLLTILMNWLAHVNRPVIAISDVS